MPILPFFDDEERKRLALTPGINPNVPLTPAPSLANLRTAPPTLPKLPPAAMAPAPPPGILPPSNLGALPEPSAPELTKTSRLYNQKAAHLEKTPGRFKSGLLGALRGGLQGLATGGGLGAALGGAIGGGALGVASPRTLREQQFNEQIKPKILERFGMEDQQQAAARQAQQDALNTAYKTAQIGELDSQAYKNRLPPPAPRPAAQQLKLGRNKQTNRLEYYDAANPRAAMGYDPAEFPQEARPLSPSWHTVNEGGRPVLKDLNAPENKGKTFRGYERPREGREPKKEHVDIGTIREAVNEAKKTDPKMTTSRMKTIFRNNGYVVDED